MTLARWLPPLLIAGSWMLLPGPATAQFPAGWETMEIEAKWDTVETTFNDIVAGLPDGGTWQGYDLNVRWSGTPKRYFDLYYDNPASDLFGALHMIRHRERRSTPDAIAISDSFAVLNAATWLTPDWEKVQYKSSPTRLAAVWFRTEQGDADLTSAQVTSTLAGVAPHPPYTANDDPVALLLGDHAGFDFSALDVVLEVIQYRYRIELLDPLTGIELYEVSLDKITTTVPGGGPIESYGVELEVLRDGPLVEDRVNELFVLMNALETEYGLTRAATSKGGIVVPDTAEPVMRLRETGLDYGDLELGFAFTKAIVVYNDGYAPLTVSVTNNSVGDPDLVHWPNLVEVVNASVPPFGDGLIVTETYEPQMEGEHGIQVEVAGDDPVLPTQVVPLSGTGVPANPIDSVLVLDRSGSMNESAGERTKIDAMRDAGDLYAHLLRTDLAAPGDQIGLVKYNHTDEVYLALDEVDDPAVPGSHMATLEDQLADDALADPARLEPDGATGIGGAMETAAALFTVPAGDREHVMVVLTDGIENRSPYIEDVIGPIQAANPDLSMYSVGVGDSFEADKLQEISNVGNGYHQVTGDLSGESLFDLETFYFKIFSHAAGMDLVVDPTLLVPIGGQKAVVVDSAKITSSDRRAVFLVLDSPELRGVYGLELVAPNGEVMVPGSTVGGVEVGYVRRHTYTIYRVVLPDPGVSADYLGDWVLRLTPKRTQEPFLRTATSEGRSEGSQGLAPVGLAAAVASNFRMRAEVLPSGYLPGAAVSLTVTLTDQGWPSPGGRAWVEVREPGGALVAEVRLRDDGTDGDLTAGDGTWTGRFIQTGAAGSYGFLFRALGRNGQGETVPREASRFVTLMRPSPRPPTPGVAQALSLHAGLVDPHGVLGRVARQGSTVHLDYLRPVGRRLAWDLRAGLSRFDGHFGQPDIDLSTLAANARLTLNPSGPVRVLVNGGGGLYHFDPGDLEAGWNLGLGLALTVARDLTLEATYNYHSTFTASPRIEFGQFQLGLIVGF